MKKQSGITLVALIITIIVMVILAGVIIVTAVMDGGVIDRAQDAMKQNERAEIQDIVIASYVYKTTAGSDVTYQQLNMKATSEAIYDNLAANKFKLLDENGQEYNVRDNFVNAQPTNATGEIQEIKLTVKGKHSEYSGGLDNKGIKADFIIIGEDDDKKDDEEEEDTTPTINPEDLALLKEVFDGKILEITSLGQTLTLKNDDETKEAEVTLGNACYIENSGDFLVEITYKGNKYTCLGIAAGSTSISYKDIRIKEETALFYYDEEYAEKTTGAYIVADKDGNAKIWRGEEEESQKVAIYEKKIYFMDEDMPIGYEQATISEDGKKLIMGSGSDTIEIEHTGKKDLEYDYLCFSMDIEIGSGDYYKANGAIYICGNGIGFFGILADEGVLIPVGTLLATETEEHLELNRFGTLYRVTGASSQREYKKIARVEGDTLEFTDDYGTTVKKGTVMTKGVYNFNSEGKSVIEAYDTEEYINLNITIDKTRDKVDMLYSGKISYCFGSDIINGGLALRKDGLYVLVSLRGTSTIDKENNTLIAPEFNSDGQPTENTVQYTISEGNKLTNKQVVNPE